MRRKRAHAHHAHRHGLITHILLHLRKLEPQGPAALPQLSALQNPPRREVKLLPKNNMLSFNTSHPPLHDAALPTPQLERDTSTRARRKNAKHSISPPAAENPSRTGSKHKTKHNMLSIRPISLLLLTLISFPHSNSNATRTTHDMAQLNMTQPNITCIPMHAYMHTACT